MLLRVYICAVSHYLDNPVYNSLISGDANLSEGTDAVKFFDEDVSPFVGFDENYKEGFSDLYDILPAHRKILYATRNIISETKGWQQVAFIKGMQFVFDGSPSDRISLNPSIQALTYDNAHEMVELATLTKPGPFNMRTIDFGSYYGIFENGRLAAMTGQRLHVFNYTEVSAVCTHPDFLGKGYASALLQHQVGLICDNGQIPFLHVREDNTRAIEVYERLGFKRNGTMNFYFLKRTE
jgi:ribosomal protein S18 acetylase RimI-like enzyme